MEDDLRLADNTKSQEVKNALIPIEQKLASMKSRSSNNRTSQGHKSVVSRPKPSWVMEKLRREQLHPARPVQAIHLRLRRKDQFCRKKLSDAVTRSNECVLLMKQG